MTRFAPGHLPGQLAPGWTPTGRELPDVAGRAAVLRDEPVTAPGGVELAWRWSEDAWAFAHLDAGFPDLPEHAHRVAADGRTGPDELEALAASVEIAADPGDSGVVADRPRAVNRPVPGTASALVLFTWMNGDQVRPDRRCPYPPARR